MFRSFFKLNMKLSDKFDELLFRSNRSFLIDGNSDVPNIVKEFVSSGANVLDVGGGRRPFYSVDQKNLNNLHITGLDISAVELKNAPAGAYDKIITSPIESFSEVSLFDLVVCIAVLEHVKNVDHAISAISSSLRSGGVAVVFIPNRNAIFARLNLLVPEDIKRKILFYFYPEMKSSSGFKSYYNLCTPRDIKDISSKYGLDVVAENYYFISGYFRFMFPIHFLWRIWSVGFRAISGNQACETFTLVLKKH